MLKDIVVIKFGGSLSSNKAAWKKFMSDLSSLVKKNNIVLVHGGGPEVSSWLERLGIATKFVDGLRYTDEASLEVVEMVLSGKVNKTIVSELLKNKINSVGISCKDGSVCISTRNDKLGFVGEPCKVNDKLIQVLLKNKFLPVVSSLSINAKGETLNVNADSVAMALAKALKAKRLILLTDVEGVLDSHKKTIRRIRAKEIPGLITQGIVTGGMIPKVKACADSIKAGVKEVWIASGVYGIKQLKGTVISK
jgi:acetylglutamate kinase